MGVTSDTGKFAMIPMWVLQNTNPTASVVYCQLATYADNDTGVCWPSHRSLADNLKMSVSTVKRAISDLIDLGALEKLQRFNLDGSPTSNEYRLIRAIPAHLRTEDSSQVDPLPSKSEPTSVHERTDNGSGMTYKLDLINYTQLTRPNELDIMPEQSSSNLNPPKKPKKSKTKTEIAPVKELTYEPIGQTKPKGTEWQDLFQAILDACTMDSKDLTKSAAGEVGAAAKQIWDVGGRAEHVALRAECYQHLFDSTTVTPSALAKHWPKCTPAKVEEDKANSGQRQRLMDEYKQKDRFAHLEQKAIGQ